MFSLIVTLLFMLLLGKKVLIPMHFSAAMIVALVLFYFVADIDVLPVLLTLFFSAPLLIHYRYSAITQFVFILCILLPSAVIYSF